MNGDWFIAVLICVELSASATYLISDGDWKQAMLWGCVGLSNVAYLAMRRS